MRSQTASTNKNNTELVLKYSNGFTLVEILVTIAISTIILSIGAFANVNLFTKEIARSEESTLVAVLQKARSRAMNNIDGVKHGVRIENGSDYYIIYEFPYSSSSSTNQKIWREKKIDVQDGDIVTGGVGYVVFDQLSGETTAGTITLVDTAGRTENIIISSNGLIDW